MDPNQTFFSSIQLMNYTVPPWDRIQFYNVCIDQPQKLISDGIWANNHAFPSKSTFTMLELQILVIFMITQSFHFLLKPMGFPYFVSQVMAGFLLGPSIPTGPFEIYKKMLFPFGTADILNTISSFGYIFFIFLNAVQMDFTLITKTGKKAWVIALLSLFTPIIVGTILMTTFSPLWNHLVGAEESYALPVVVISHSGCSFAVIASLLNDLKILNSELGRLALSSAFLNDISGSVVAGLGTSIMNGVKNHVAFSLVVRNVVLFFVYLVAIPLIGRRVMRWMIRNTPEGRPVNKIYIYMIVIMFLLLGHLAGNFNQPFLAGAVILGIAVPEGPPLGSELVYRLELFSSWFLVPIFVTSCTMKVDLTNCEPPKLVVVIICFIAMVHLIKILQCVGICRLCNMPTRDGFCLALILSCKGVVEICSFTLVYDGMRQTPQAIGVMVVSVLIMGTVSRIGVKALYDPSRKYAGYQKRNIMSLKNTSELRVVACVHKLNHMIHIKDFLQVCSPAPDNTLVVDVVHLLELIGRTTPVFIAHRLQQKLGSTNDYSGELIVTFDLFERDYAGSATANTSMKGPQS